MLVIRGAVKDYDWGIVDGLQPWTGVSTGSPQAELWFGVHPSGPSPVVGSDEQVLADHFDVTHIPILVKILAARRPLSVQVHPTQELALWGWAMQGAGQLEAPDVLSDPFEKTEMLVAIEPFEAFAGWRDVTVALRMLEQLTHTESSAEALARGDRAGAITALLALPESVRSEWIRSLPDAARAAGLPVEEVQAYATVAQEYPDDAGAPLTVLLQYERLEPGEALFVPAGVPHSYICGRGVEVMTSSDNVVRLGLTPKPVFVDMAMRVLDFHGSPVVLRANVGDELEPLGAPFSAQLLESGERDFPAGRYRIVLALAGDVQIHAQGVDVELHAGTAAVFPADEADVRVRAVGLAALVSAPVFEHEHDHDHDHGHGHTH